MVQYPQAAGLVFNDTSNVTPAADHPGLHADHYATRERQVRRLSVRGFGDRHVLPAVRGRIASFQRHCAPVRFESSFQGGRYGILWRIRPRSSAG